jgi:hypothetical protein
VNLLIAVLVVWLLFALLGFLLHVLWFLALVVLVAWLLGFALRRGQGARWYRW